jgi:membrane complex biogenesis BtpA family protein
MMFRKIFPQPKPIIGMIALPPLLGYPEFSSIDAAIDRALTDLETLETGGVDGVLIENDFDQPHQIIVAPEIVASFTRIAQEVTKRSRIPVGVQVLLNDWRASLAIAKVTGARFVRMDFFVDRSRIAAGVIDPEPENVIAYRKKISAEDVALFTDVQVKYSELLESGKTLATSTQEAISHGTDAVVVTGNLTGEMPTLVRLREVRKAAQDCPVLIGSGAAPENIRELFQYADGAIVGTSFKNSMAADERVIPERVERFMKVVRAIRDA